MQIRAILVVNSETRVSGIQDTPLAEIEVLGKPLLQHIVEQMGRSGVDHITLVSNLKGFRPAYLRNRSAIRCVQAPQTSLWQVAQQELESVAHNDDEVLIVARAESYVELDWAKAASRSGSYGDRGTLGANGSFKVAQGIYILSRSNPRDAEYFLADGLADASSNTGAQLSEDVEYFNPLKSCHDLRQLAVDGLYQKCRILPSGREVRPGIWMDRGSNVPKDARLVAPVYIGKRAKVRRGAVVTRGSSLEHHSTVDCGTVIEDATLLPLTEVGAELDVAHCVAGAGRIVHLPRNAEVAIKDPMILRQQPDLSLSRAVLAAGSLLSFFPRQIFNGIFPSAASNRVRAVSENRGREFGTNLKPEGKPHKDVPELATELAVVRRYGNE